MRYYADLHVHSTASDGCLNPRQMVAMAARLGFGAVAIADHDSISGTAEALEAGRAFGVEVIPAVELSSMVDGAELHVLGYYIRWREEGLLRRLESVRSGRVERAREMVDKLRRLGVDLEFARVLELARGDYVGRPHIARAMVEKGYVRRLAEAFTPEYIGNGGAAYVSRHELQPLEAIQLIHAYGGVAVLAHPGSFKDGEPTPDSMITELARHGLEGLECYTTKHSPELRDHYIRLASVLNLLVTGGSDCHGEEGEERLMGKVRLPYRYVELLKTRAHSR